MPHLTDYLPAKLREAVGWCGGGESEPSRFFPYFDHVRPNVMLLRDGGVMAMVRLRHGFEFALADGATRAGTAGRHFAMLQLLSDPQTEIVEHLVCHDGIAPFPAVDGGSEFCRDFMQNYQIKALGRLRQFDWFISVIVRPRALSDSWVKNLYARMAGHDPVLNPKLIRLLNAKLRTIAGSLRMLAPVRLGVRHEGAAQFSEIGEAINLIRTTRYQRVPLTQPIGSLCYSMYRDRVVHGELGFRIEWGGSRSRATFGRMFGLNVYPKKTRIDMFEALLKDDDALLGARWCMTNAIRSLSRAKATDRLELTLQRMEKSQHRAETDMRDLEDALDALSTSKEVRGDHAWSFAVHADDRETMEEKAAAYLDVIAGGGCSPAPAGIAGQAAYWMQLPGNRHFSPQPATIGMRAYADLSSLEGYPVGEAIHRWGAPLMRFSTSGGTAYDHELFDGQLGHTLFCGPSGSGKTNALGACATAATRLLGGNGLIIFIDKDDSNKLTVVNNGGSHIKMRRNADSGAAPLKRLRNTADDRGIAFNILHGAILADGLGPISQRATERLKRGIEFVMRLPPNLRTIGAVHAWMPPAKFDPSGAADRLKPWCRGERIGWALDGEVDRFDFAGNMVGIDFTELLDESTILPVIAAYVFQAAGRMMDGRRLIFIVEELRFLLPKPEFTQPFEDILLTGRKKNVCFWPVIQQPEHLLTHPIGTALLGQCRTRFLFKNELANRAAYCGGGSYGDGLHATPQIYQQVREGMTTGKWSFVLQRPGKNLLCRFDLSSMPDALAVFSAMPKSIALWDSIAETRREFLDRLDEAKA
jgi:type IV secretion system protein VirB4